MPLTNQVTTAQEILESLKDRVNASPDEKKAFMVESLIKCADTLAHYLTMREFSVPLNERTWVELRFHGDPFCRGHLEKAIKVLQAISENMKDDD